MLESLISTKGRITIPAELRKKFWIKQGSAVSWKEENGRLILTLDKPPGTRRLKRASAKS